MVVSDVVNVSYLPVDAPRREEFAASTRPRAGPPQVRWGNHERHGSDAPISTGFAPFIPFNLCPLGAPLSTLYLIALGAVCVAILGALIEAVLSVSGPKAWPARRPILTLASSVDRRVREVPFVGADRRGSAEPSVSEQQRLSA